MSNPFFRFRQFTVYHDKCAMKVGTDGVLLGAWANVKGAKTILDVGTGSGLIALMLAQRSDAQIWAIEIDKDASIQASENCLNSPWKERIRIVHESFEAFADSTLQRFDHIVSNPPFFSDSLKSFQEKRNAARHDDQLSMEDLVKGISSLLKDDGRFSLVLPSETWTEINRIALYHALFCNRKCFIKTRPSLPLKRILLEFSRRPSPVEEKTITVYLQGEEYSPEYIDLTKDFYLPVVK